jgi:hypothetical protein
MTQETKKALPDDQIVHHAKAWRHHDRTAIANKENRQSQREEYRARQELRKVIDQSEAP